MMMMSGELDAAIERQLQLVQLLPDPADLLFSEPDEIASILETLELISAAMLENGRHIEALLLRA